jgi:hypothetical protein
VYEMKHKNSSVTVILKFLRSHKLQHILMHFTCFLNYVHPYLRWANRPKHVALLNLIKLLSLTEIYVCTIDLSKTTG